MQEKLNIPLESELSKSRYSIALRYKRWLLGMLVFIILLGAHRLWIIRDLTSGFHTNGIESSLRIIKTPSTIKQLHENLGSETIISGRSLTFDDILLLSDREFSLHMDEAGIVHEITIDSGLSDQKHQYLYESGFIIYSSGNKTIISTINTNVLIEKAQLHPIYALNPWHDGEWTEYSGEKNRDSPVSISNSGLKIGQGETNTIKYNTSIATNTEILANYSVGASAPLPLLVQSLLTNVAASSFINQITTSGFQLIIGNDEAGESFYISVPATKTNTQEMAQLAQNLLKIFNLSTLALTMDDGTTVSEIRSDTSNFVSTIETESGVSFLTISDAQGNLIYIAQTTNFWTISNRKTSLASADFTNKSTCSANAHSFLYPRKILERITSDQSALSYSTGIPFVLRFKELAVAKNTTTMCW